MTIATHEIPHNVLSVTALLGRDTIFRDTPLSQQLGLEQGSLIPSELAEADILLWVESAILQTPLIDPEEVRRLREELGMTPEEFASYVGLPPATLVGWETEAGKPTKQSHRLPNPVLDRPTEELEGDTELLDGVGDEEDRRSS